MHPLTFHDLLEANRRARPEKTALVTHQEEVSYGALADRVEALAGGLNALGLGRGDLLCVHLPKSIDEVVISFAASRLGAAFVNLNAQLAVRQLRHALADSRPRLVVTTAPKARALLEEGLPNGIERLIVAGPDLGDDRAIALADLPTGRLPEPRTIDVDLCAVLYTSGSTGLPKGVMLSHRNVVQSAMAAATHLENREDDRALGVLPLSFDYGLSQLTTMCLVGGTLVLPRATLPAEILKTVAAHDVNAIALVPTMWIPLIRLLDEGGITLPGVRYVANSGGQLSAEALRRWTRIFPEARHYLMYGMTEGFRSSFLPPADFERKLGSIGVPLPNVELYVVSDGRLCGPGEHGELIHRGGLISMGYMNAPEATSEKIRPCPALEPLIGEEPVLYSGDTVYRDEEGYLWFVARTTTFIKCSDFRVSPTEVEEIAFESGLVDEAVAFGVRDADLGQIVHLAVRPRRGAPFDAEALAAFCRDEMPGYMVPRRIHVWEGAMPLTPNGKIDRPAVIARFEEEA